MFNETGIKNQHPLICRGIWRKNLCRGASVRWEDNQRPTAEPSAKSSVLKTLPSADVEVQIGGASKRRPATRKEVSPQSTPTPF